MAVKTDFLDRLQKGTVLFDGGNGTEFYKNGVFINQCFDELNLRNPRLVMKVHEEYKKAGADVLETNTFGANRFKLKPYNLSEKLYEINFEGARLAREVAGDELYVAGAIGPLGAQIEPLGPISREEAVEYYKEIVQPLLDGGVDLFILETFIYPDELAQAVKAVRELCSLPIVANMTIDEDTASLTGAQPEVMIRELEHTGADVIGINCTTGPQVMLQWLEKVRNHSEKPIAIMPNAGKPKNIEGRTIYLASPEYFGEYAKHFILSGANIIGGCCGTSPEHIKKMRNTITSLQPQTRKFNIELTKPFDTTDINILPKERKSRLAKRLSDNHFVTFVELLAPRGVALEGELDKARELFFSGIDVINIPDGPRASARMSALALAVKIQREVGIETVLHYVCRDRNVIGMQSDLLGAYALGLKNILAVTGDPPKLGNYPDATAVFDVDSIGLVNILNRLNHGLDIAGNPIGKPTGFYVGVGANPGAINIDEEIRRLEWKAEAGAEYIITQPVFDLRIFEKFLEKIEHIKLPVIAGIWPLASLRNAEFMNNEIPGCHVPKEIIERLKNYEGDKDSSRREGISIAKEILESMIGTISGVQISVPFGRVQSVHELLEGFVFV